MNLLGKRYYSSVSKIVIVEENSNYLMEIT